MIQTSKYNGINFNTDFSRESKFFDNNLQRNVNYFSPCNAYLSFFYETELEVAPDARLIVDNDIYNEFSYSTVQITGGFIYFFNVNYGEPENFTEQLRFFKLDINGEKIYSEFFKIVSPDLLAEMNIYKLFAYNEDFTNGFLDETRFAFGFFEVNELNLDKFANDKTSYEYAYSRKLTLISKNQIVKQLTFMNLSMYQRNLLKWLCNCQNLTINGKDYQLISDFSEIGKVENSEIFSLQAEFVESEQTFFTNANNKIPKLINPNNYFI